MPDTIIHNDIVIKQELTRKYVDIGSDFINIPKKTTAQILSHTPVKGFIVYNTDTNEIWVGEGTKWLISSFLDSNEKIIPLNFTTTNNTYTAIVDEPMNDNDVLWLQVFLQGRLQGTNQIWLIDQLRGAVKQGGVITIVSAANNRIVENMTTNAAFNFINNANISVRFQVHSGTTQTINWIGEAYIRKVSLP